MTNDTHRLFYNGADLVVCSAASEKKPSLVLNQYYIDSLALPEKETTEQPSQLRQPESTQPSTHSDHFNKVSEWCARYAG